MSPPGDSERRSCCAVHTGTMLQSLVALEREAHQQDPGETELHENAIRSSAPRTLRQLMMCDAYVRSDGARSAPDVASNEEATRLVDVEAAGRLALASVRACVFERRRAYMARGSVRNAALLGRGTFGDVYAVDTVPPAEYTATTAFAASAFQSGARMRVALKLFALPYMKNADADAPGVSDGVSLCATGSADEGPHRPRCSNLMDAANELGAVQHSAQNELAVLLRLARVYALTGTPIAPLPITWLTSRSAMMIGMDCAYCDLTNFGRRLARCIARTPLTALTWDDIEHILYRIFECLAAAHAQGVLHLDLCPRNVLVYAIDFSDPAHPMTPSPSATEDAPVFAEVRLGDWGSSRCVDENTGTVSTATEGAYHVTRTHRAPELFLDPDAPFGAAVDVWAAAISAIELCWRFTDTDNPLNIRHRAAEDDPFPCADLLESLVERLGMPKAGTRAESQVKEYLERRDAHFGIPGTPEDTDMEHQDTCDPEVASEAPRASDIQCDETDETANPAPTLCRSPDMPTIRCADNGTHPASAPSPTPESPSARVTSLSLDREEVMRRLDIDRRARILSVVMRAMQRDGKPVDPVALEPRVPTPTRKLVYAALEWDPALRPTARQVLLTSAYWTRPVAQIAAHRIPIPRTSLLAALRSAS